ncbi:Protein kinase domain-containing protein [Psidium guajava]|nr:Protein kinase domain-containing protein [Psidium guajava]
MQGECDADPPENPEPPSPTRDSCGQSGASDDDLCLDVSGENLEYSLLSPTLSGSSVKDLYLYKNEFSLLPKWVGKLRRLKTLKFFANELNLFPNELGSLVGLECLQVKISPPGLNGLALHKLEGLKELELSKALRRPSVFPLLGEIAQLKCLTRLSVCHFSIRCLPPEIGCLNKLEYLDLSFNKMKSLPNEISYLNSLTSLKVANNKLVELPSDLSSLRRLEVLDLSNNRLTSVGPLGLDSMHSLRSLNLQNNKLLSFQIPSWISCDIDRKELSNDDSANSLAEMEVYESTPDVEGTISSSSFCHSSASLLAGSASNARCFLARKSKRWKRRNYLQQKARLERLNNSRKWKGEKYSEELTIKGDDMCKLSKDDASRDAESEITHVDGGDKVSISGEVAPKDVLSSVDENSISSKSDLKVENRLNVAFDPASRELGDITIISNASADKQDAESLVQKQEVSIKCKRYCDQHLDNPKPCKCRRRPADESLDLSRQYCDFSFCGAEDYLPDGFYDAGRDQPFMPLSSYERNLPIDSREVILVDRDRDEVLDAVTLTAQALVIRFKRLSGLTKDQELEDWTLQISSLLALFVSDHFGGCDRNAIIERTRKAASGSNYEKPFVCTCLTGNRDYVDSSVDQMLNNQDIILSDLCERSLQSIKARQSSVIVPIGTLKFGVCRHRAILMKYLCDRMVPPVPCELVRGYLDFSPHAWNIILVKKGDLWVRMVVDACRPLDIREETDPEYACRYIPLRRFRDSLSMEGISKSGCVLPSLSTSDEIYKAASTSIVHCTNASANVVAKVRFLEVCGNSVEEIRKFEYSCLGEVRILGALQHACIVEMYGHQISSQRVTSEDANPEHRMWRSAIYMEYVKGGSLKNYLEKLSKSGEKHVPVNMGLFIARDVASALVELHSKHIIHRDIKSENILIDLDARRADGTPIVKLCDFDRAVPLRSSIHTCCLAHIGVHPPNTCVGTPRWMAPEVLQTMHKHESYGLEVDIWSYGCLIFELLTLQVPYSGLSEPLIHDLIQQGERPKLTDDMDSLASLNDHSSMGSGSKSEGPEVEHEALKFLVDLFCRCTKKNPADRPSARDIYDSILVHVRDFVRIHGWEPERLVIKLP